MEHLVQDRPRYDGMVHYVYVLRSHKDGALYIGSTSDLRARVNSHNSGAVPATKPRRPLALMFYEAFRSKTDAVRREQYFKTTKGKVALRLMLRGSLAP